MFISLLLTTYQTNKPNNGEFISGPFRPNFGKQMNYQFNFGVK